MTDILDQIEICSAYGEQVGRSKRKSTVPSETAMVATCRQNERDRPTTDQAVSDYANDETFPDFRRRLSREKVCSHNSHRAILAKNRGVGW